MVLQLQFIGSILILLGLVHIIFPSYFKWTEELKAISLINRQLMYVHTFFIALVVVLNGFLCLLAAEDLIFTALGKKICAGLAFFWGLRLFFQFFVYSPQLWRGKTFETIVHILFSMLWIYLTGFFSYIAFYQ
jgi:hypothetical protein